MEEKDVFIRTNSRAFNYGDGFFETIKVINSTPFNFSSHIHRINCASLILKIDSLSSSFLEEKISHLIKFNNISDGMIKIHISRGGCGKYLPESDGSDLLISAINGMPYNINKSVSLCFYEEEHKTSAGLSNIKTINSLIYVLASMYARERHFDNAILFNNSGNILESTSSNIFFVRNRQIYTPSILDGCVDGTMRRWLSSRLDIIEKSVLKDELLESDEVFLTNASSGFISVNNIEKTSFTSSRIANSLQKDLISSSLGL